VIKRIGDRLSSFRGRSYPWKLEVCSVRAGSFQLGVREFVLFVAGERAANAELIFELLRGEEDILWEVT